MKQKGFTLIELLVTMGVIAVLTGMAVFNFNQSRMRARDVQRKSDLGQLMSALELYKIDNGSYPVNTHYPAIDKNNEFQTLLLGGEYTKTTFVDPKGSSWQNYYYTNNGGSKMKYSIMTCLENKADTARANTTQCGYFPNNQGGNVPCICGTNFAGTMYVVSNP